MKLVVGLGNPGPRYANTRHNVGFMVLDDFARQLNLNGFQKKFGGEFSKAQFADTDLVLIKPMEFMNNSGESLSRFASFFKIAADDVFVVHDEIDLPHGKLRVKSGGGHGGHNGLRSIIAHLGSADFQRLRVGVGKPGDSESKQSELSGVSIKAPGPSVADHVLGAFSKNDSPPLSEIIDRSTKAIKSMIEYGMTKTMNEFNA